MSVKVGVRVRPFNGREMELNCRLCVDMHGVTTKLLDLDDPKRNRDFSFDYSFWSHDSFEPNAAGYFEGTSGKYSDQQMVYKAVGVEILDNAWEGYHCCLFAYGQTGAGKSYSMVGYGANKGIVPISCEEIFNRIKKNPNPKKQYEVDLSMLEIYNERVQDLLIPIAKRPREGLKIREHKTQGVYVEGLSKHPVSTYEMIEQKMEEGSRNRSVAATEMNANSSRAHTIISIEFRQKEIVNDKKVQKLSVIYLVDLAGSEKVGKTGATGDRLKEAAGINKSLSVLGLVISTLADKATGKGKNIIVPYRDSCLTRILQNALGGNSKTLMICAISPATDNYEQTLSTLRYADQAKKIQNKAVVNESDTDKMIRELTEQNKKLKDYLQMFSKIGVNIQDEATMTKFQEIQSELKFNNAIITTSSMSKEEREKIIEVESTKMSNIGTNNKINLSKPHLTNLNEDPQLSQKIFYSLEKENAEAFLIGKKSEDHKNDLEINSFGMPLCLATISQEEGKLTLIPSFYFSCKEKSEDFYSNSNNNVYLNGVPVTTQQVLMQSDRLKLGLNSIFLVNIPGSEERERKDKTAELDWEYAEKQLYEYLEEQEKEKEEKNRVEELKRLAEKEAQLAQITKKKIQDEVKNLKQKLQSQLQQKHLQVHTQQQNQLKRLKLQRQIQQQKKRLKEQEKSKKNKTKYYFQNKLMKTYPKITELNLIAKEFKRNISFSLKIMVFDDEEYELSSGDKMNIKIQVDNKELNYRYYWDLNKFSNRYYMLRDMLEKYYETGIIPELPQNEDPFWDPQEPVAIANAYTPLKGLTYLIDNPDTIAIIGENIHCGELKINILPSDDTGTRNLSEEMDEEMDCEPSDLLGKPFFFKVCVYNGKIPDNYSSVFVEYTLKVNEIDKETFRTEECKELTKNPVWNYEKVHSYSCLTDSIIDYLSKSSLVFKVFGMEILERQKEKPKRVEGQKVLPDQEIAKKEATVVNVQKQPIKKSEVIPVTKKVTDEKKAEKDSKKEPKKEKVADKKEKDKDCLLF